MNFTPPVLVNTWRSWNLYALLVGIMQLLWKSVQADLILLYFLHYIFVGFFWGNYYYFFFLQIEGLWQLCIVR